MASETSVVTPQRFEEGFSYGDYIDQIKVNKARFEEFHPTFPIWLNIPLSKSSAFFKPLSICETLAVGMAIITP